MKKLILFILLVFSASMYVVGADGIVYVKPGGSGDGSSWENALGDIQAGISAANALDPKGEVWVQAGTYTVTTTVAMSQGVNVYGGFTGTETSKDARVKGESGKPWDFVNETIVDGGGAVRPMEVRGNFEVETILDGFTMTNGNGKSAGNLDGSGGGLVLRPGFTVQNCIIKNNTSNASGNFGGGGITATGGTLINSYIYGNSQITGNNGGGGIHVNTAADMETIIDNCTFEGNSSTVRGGGLNVQGRGITKMNRLIIFNNSAEGKPGGAIYQNSPNNIGVNLLVYNNTGTNAIQLQGSLLNSTVVNNIGGVFVIGSGSIDIANNIIWGCETVDGAATGITGTNTSAIVEHNGTYTNIVEGNYLYVANNIKFASNNSNGDVEGAPAETVGSGPKFVKVSTFKGAAQADEEVLILDSVNWNLQGASPCVDAGKEIEAAKTDLIGQARPYGDGAYDLGVYEYVPGTGISNNEFIYSVYSKDRQIVISGFDHPVKVAVYSIAGQVVYNKTTAGSSIKIPVQEGIYIVRVDNAAQKVIVR